MMARIVRMAMLSCALAVLWSFVVPKAATVEALETLCQTSGAIDLFVYPGPWPEGFVAEGYGNSTNFGGSEGNCADTGLAVMRGVGRYMCASGSYGAGQGYVMLWWGYTYRDEQIHNHSVSFQQQYDCGDV